MSYLLIVSLVWAFSFGLTKEYLVGLDPNFVAWARLMFALPLFLPFIRLHGLGHRLRLELLAIGAIQYGVMYGALFYSYRFLEAYEVALFTILTPLYIILIDDAFERRFRPHYLILALVAVGGAAIIRYEGQPMGQVAEGFLLIQVSNLCFAFGQLAYRRLRQRHGEWRDRELFIYLYLGAAVVATLATTVNGGWSSFAAVGEAQLWSLLYLGVLASGLSFFWWNIGATLTNTGTLAVFNNLKIPLAVAAAIVIFGETASLGRLFLGGSIMVAAAALAEWFAWRRKQARVSEELAASAPKTNVTA